MNDPNYSDYLSPSTQELLDSMSLKERLAELYEYENDNDSVNEDDQYSLL